MGRFSRLLFLLTLILLSPKCQSWGWFSSSSEKNTRDANYPGSKEISKYGGAFSVEGYNDKRGAELVEKARHKMDVSNSCWQNAYQNLFAACSDIFANEDKRSRFAWQLADCFQKDTGRGSFPFCDPESSMQKCLGKINEGEHGIYLEFYLETNTICHQLQANVFKQETERLVNDLKSSAQYAEHQIETIEEKSELLLQSSSQIYGSLNTIDSQTQELAQQTKDVQGQLVDLLNHSATLHEKSMDIATSQLQLQKGQSEMQGKLAEGMDMIHESYRNLEQEIDGIRKEAEEIEKEIIKVGNEMSSRMNNLQSKAEDIGNMAVLSLDKQKELLEGQGTALNGLQYLSKFQSQALEESRIALQKMAEYSSRQQEELLRRQKQLQEVHDQVATNSKAILAAQETFEAKQSSMLIALDKLFALVNTLLVESRMINAILFYIGLTFIVYMVTSAKPTYLRPRLFIGVWATFFIEVAILWYTTNRETWITTLIIKSVRLTYLLLAAAQYLYAILTYRDYETLNHQMLLTLIEKVNYLHKTRELSWEEASDIDWSSWIDTDLPEDVNNLEDPDFMVPEEVGESSITSSVTRKRYNLRSRH